MAESIVQVTEGVGKKLHTWNRTIGANSVEDEAVFLAEFPLAGYSIVGAGAFSVATANDHVFQVMAGASLKVRIRRIRVWQAAAATTAAAGSMELWRLTSAGTGGTAITPAKLDTADAAAGATAMTLPTVKGTEGTLLDRPTVNWRQTAPAAGGPNIVYEWTEDPTFPAIVIPAGTANGIALKVVNATAAATISFHVIAVETNF